jgi:hypothetical protein
VNENSKNWYANNREKVKENKIKNYLRLLEKNPELTKENRQRWGQVIRHQEGVNGGFQSHHILPLSLFDWFGLEIWNGAPLHIEWHVGPGSIHNQMPSLPPEEIHVFNYMLHFMDFVEQKIKESNKTITTLDEWGVV